MAVRIVVVVPVVGETQSTLHVATHEVVVGATHVRIHEVAEVGIQQGLRSLVDDRVVVEGHVIDLVVGAEGEGLCPNFETNGLPTERFGMHVALIVEDPKDVVVPEEVHRVLTLAVLAILYGLIEPIIRIIAIGRLMIPSPL